MEVRSYYANSVEAAMDLARRELGPEALLIESGLAAPDCAHLGRYKAVFTREMARIQLQPASEDTLPPLDLLPHKREFAALLASAGISRRESERFFDGGSKSRPLAERRLPELNAVRVPDLACSPGLGRAGFAETAVALAGPAGGGKTTTIMKLALMHGVLMARPVRLFAFDPARLASTCRLQWFARLLNLEYAAFETLEELSSAVAKPAAGLTFIDTEGYGQHRQSTLRETAQALLRHPKIETQLVLRVDRKTADSRKAMQLFSPFEATRLVLTAFDESSDNSGLAALVEAAELPVSFLGVGQRIPEDLEPARGARLSALILNGWPEPAQSAA